MVDEAVGAARRPPRLAHTDQIGSKTATEHVDMRDDVAPEVGRRGIAVQEDDRLARARVDVGDLRVEDPDALAGMRIRDRERCHGDDCNRPEIAVVTRV